MPASRSDRDAQEGQQLAGTLARVRHRDNQPLLAGVEAGASGLPLIATDVPGCRDVISSGRDGILVPPRNAIALADAISRLVADGVLASRLGAAAREKVVATFNESDIVKNTLDVYEELIPGFATSLPTR